MGTKAHWNHNINYHPLILATVARGCDRVLDVGCGEGVLTLELGEIARHVTGIDLDSSTIERAKEQAAAVNIDYVIGDFLTSAGHAL